MNQQFRGTPMAMETPKFHHTTGLVFVRGRTSTPWDPLIFAVQRGSWWNQPPQQICPVDRRPQKNLNMNYMGFLNLI